MWFINSNNTTLTTDETTATSWHETASTTSTITTTWNDTTSTSTSWHETSGHIRDDGDMIERHVGAENREQDQPSSVPVAIIAPNDTEITRTMTTAESATATANISTTTTTATTTTTKSTTISTTDVVFLSEKLRSNADDKNYEENDEGSDNDEEENDDKEEMISDSENKCPSIPPNLVGRLKVNLTSPSWEELETTPSFTRLRPGGEFSPAGCDPEFSGELWNHGKLLK